ncbi:MAG: HNH endonuclease signature motif containing protein [Sandaracinaceae bacterium]
MAIEHANAGVVEPGHWLECLVFEGASTLLGSRPHLAELYEQLEPPPPRPRGEPALEAVPRRASTVDDGFDLEPITTDAPATLDAIVRDRAARFASRDLWLGELLSRFLLARGWIALGYPSEQSWFDERLGLARSTARGRVTLARRVRGLAQLGDALCKGEVGYEQAAMIARVAGPDTTDAWIERAKARTYKHLAEEVRAAELLARVAGEPPRQLAPPEDEELEAVFDLERDVLSGESIGAALRDGDAVQMSVGRLLEDRRRTFPVRARDEVILHFRRLERVHRASGWPGSFVTFLVLAYFDAWGPRFLEGNRWKELHDRDRHRCLSPVCESRNTTNHHVRYRAHGGGDEAENQITLCEFCHLEGEHGGRLRVRGTASRPEWWIGRTPVMHVVGREVRRR